MGSSSSRTFGSPISSRISCSRRRSPPLRSRTSVRPFSPPKPKRSQSIPAVSSRAVAEPRAALDLLDGLEHAQVAGDLGRVLGEEGELDRRALRRPTPRPAPASPATSRISVVLPEPLTPTSAKRSPGPSRQVASRRMRRSPVGERDVLGVDHLVAEPRGREAQQLGAVAHLGLVGDQRVRRLDPELRLRRARRRPAAQPRELLAEQLLAALLARRRLPLALGAREHVGRVAALVLVHVGVGDLPRVRADGVQEPAIVGDDQDRPAARREMPREPVDAFDVQVVRRLVEQQQLGVVEQRLAPARSGAARRRSRARSACPAPAGSARSRRRRAARRARCGRRRRPSTRGRPARRRARPGSSAVGSRSSPWPSIAMCSPPERVTAPASGSSIPAISRSSVDLPSPLRPTIPIRSPAEMPSVTSASTVRAA